MTSLDFSAILHPDDPPLPLAVMTESGLRSRDTAELRASLTPRLWDYGITRVANLTGLDNVATRKEPKAGHMLCGWSWGPLG